MLATCHLSLSHQELITVGEFQVTKLKDYRQSYIEILNLKHAMRDELLQTWLPGLGLPQDHVKKMQEVFNDVPSVRKALSGYPKEPQVDTSWMVGWPQSSMQACNLIEELIYTVEYDGRYKDCVKTKGKVADMMEYESVRRELDEVATLLTQERAAAAAARGETLPGDPAVPGAGAGTAASAGTGIEASTPDSKGFHTMEKHDQDHWEKVINKQIKTYIDIIVEPKSAAELQNALTESRLANIKGDPTGLVLIHFDVKQSGEPQTRPELRVAPLREASYHRLVRAVLSSRAPAGAPAGLRSGEVAVLLDGGRRGNSNKLLAPWREGTKKDKTMEAKADDDEEGDDDDQEDAVGDDGEEVQLLGFNSTILNLIYNEQSLATRRKKLRVSTGCIHQSEWVHMISHAKVCLPERARKNYPGTTSGDTIFGVTVPELDTEWSMTWGEKKVFYGKKNLIAVGGKTKGASPDDAREARTDTVVEPVTYHGMPHAWYEELIHTFFCKAVVDLTPLDGKFAWVCLTNRIGYVGIAFTEKHQEMLYDRLKVLLKAEMCKAGSRLYNAQYARAAGIEAETPDPKPKPKPKPKRRGRKTEEKPEEDPEANPEDDPEANPEGLEPEADPEEEPWDPFA